MGNEITGNNGKTGRVIIEEVRPAGGTNGTSGNGTSAASTGTRTPAGGTGGNGTGGNPDTGTKAGEKREQISELAILTDEERAAYMTADDAEKKRIMRNARKRERYRQQKASGGQTVKPRKVNGKKQEQTPALDVTQLNLMIAGLSAAIASRPNCEQWLLTEAEINSITVPLSKMLAESETFANMGQYSNQIALTVACFTVFTPRIVTTVQKQKEGKRIARSGQNTNTTVTDSRIRDTGKTENSNIKPDRRNESKPTANGSNDGKELPFYGIPIC